MHDSELSDDQLLAWLDEALTPERMSEIERELRDSEPLRNRMAGLIRRRDDGVHSVGEIWRRHRLTCPTRVDLGSWLLGSLDTEYAKYIDFHIRTVGCRICSANLTDLENSAQPTEDSTRRRRRFFQSSAGHLPKPE
ncbi:anti-sigma factor [Thalassoroseus pseudoceratinae]|uniref:hypothetical protein n=1 Tax=Thalassoroseus pseudoceratinae TaxID=2713176 RepID=UPI00141DBE06|nr:hypothetical protein [Thalassoroseus pseudoceratinae]